MVAQEGAGASEHALTLLARAHSGAVHGGMHAANTPVARARCISAEPLCWRRRCQDWPHNGSRSRARARWGTQLSKEAVRDEGRGRRRAAWTCGVLFTSAGRPPSPAGHPKSAAEARLHHGPARAQGTSGARTKVKRRLRRETNLRRWGPLGD